MMLKKVARHPSEILIREQLAIEKDTEEKGYEDVIFFTSFDHFSFPFFTMHFVILYVDHFSIGVQNNG